MSEIQPNQILNMDFVIKIKSKIRTTKWAFIFRQYRNFYYFTIWQLRGKTGAVPHWAKEQLVKGYAKKFDRKVFIETGTYLGEMVAAVKDNFEEIYSIELSSKFHSEAVLMFKSYTNICLINGDSGEVLNELLPSIRSTCLLWLDAHYSGGITAKSSQETPIIKELESVFKNIPDPVILIDDANNFNGEHDYPTLKNLKSFVTSIHPSASITIKYNVICISL